MPSPARPCWPFPHCSRSPLAFSAVSGHAGGGGAVGDGRCGRCVGLGGAGGAFVGKLPSSAISSAEPWGWDVADRIRVIHAAMYLKGPTRARVLQWPAPQADTDTLHMTPPGGTSLCVHVSMHAWCVIIPWSCQWSGRAGWGFGLRSARLQLRGPRPDSVVRPSLDSHTD